MSAEQHRAEAESSKTPIELAIVVVSSTRTPDTDRSGARIAEMCAAAGYPSGERRFVDDAIGPIRQIVTDLASKDTAAVILTGGTGLSGRDVTPEALAPLLHPAIDGFGELFRALSFQEIGAAAMMSRALAGLCGRTLVFALPGSRAACELALDKLVLPELAHLVQQARKERPIAAAAPAGEVIDVPFEPVQAGAGGQVAAGEPAMVATGGAGAKLSLGQSGPPAASAPARDAEIGWAKTIATWGAQILDQRPPIPEEIERIAPIYEILSRAGDFGTLQLADGRQYALFGYPDLLRPSSKVLAVRCDDAGIHILAVHRWPVQTGTCVDGDSALTPSRSQPTAEVAERICGRAPSTAPGPLFAVAGEAIWFVRDRKVVRFDGRKESDQGTSNQALASLVLDWSQR